MRPLTLLFILSCMFIFSACNIEPEPINFGEDQCVYCKMTISDPKYGAELVTKKGRIYKFDAIECMIHYQVENSETAFKYTMAVAYDDPKSLKKVEGLFFVKNPQFKSPMGESIAAFVNEPQKFESMKWEKLQNILN